MPWNLQAKYELSHSHFMCYLSFHHVVDNYSNTDLHMVQLQHPDVS
jgi:hypothetical protein